MQFQISNILTGLKKEGTFIPLCGTTSNRGYRDDRALKLVSVFGFPVVKPFTQRLHSMCMIVVS
jgi:hypothetical protein